MVNQNIQSQPKIIYFFISLLNDSSFTTIRKILNDLSLLVDVTEGIECQLIEVTARIMQFLLHVLDNKVENSSGTFDCGVGHGSNVVPMGIPKPDPIV